MGETSGDHIPKFRNGSGVWWEEGPAVSAPPTFIDIQSQLEAPSSQDPPETRLHRSRRRFPGPCYFLERRIVLVPWTVVVDHRCLLLERGGRGGGAWGGLGGIMGRIGVGFFVSWLLSVLSLCRRCRI